MRKAIILIIFVYLFSHSQQYFSEAPIYIQNGKRFTNLIHIKFKDGVTLPETKNETSLQQSSLMTEFPSFKSIIDSNLTRLNVAAKNVLIKKTFKERDGFIQPEIADKIKRVYSIVFPELEYLEPLVLLISFLDIIEYCHGPIETVNLTFPDDPDYENEGQWSLTTRLGIRSKCLGDNARKF